MDTEENLLAASVRQTLANEPPTWPEIDHVPLWRKGDIMRGESMLLISDTRTGLATAPFLFPCERLLSVRRATGEALPLDVFAVDGNALTAPASGLIPFLPGEVVFPEEPSSRAIGHHRDGRRYLHFSEGDYFHQLQLSVDYESSDPWPFPAPKSQLARLPRLSKRMNEQAPITIVAVGDSISVGANASGRTGAEPYQPHYLELLRRRLACRTNSLVNLHNLSKGGMTTEWGKEQAASAVVCQPDLVVIAFGMNDGSGPMGMATFKENILSLMAVISKDLPEVEFLLVSGMTPNPQWSVSYPEHREAIHQSLQSLAGPGVGLADVYTTWTELAWRKGFLSLTGNGVNHPNDFGHRIYADCLMAALS